MYPGILLRKKPMPTIRLRRDRLKRLRDRAGITTDTQLADLISVNRAQVSRVLAGKCDPGIRFVAGMLDAFGVAAFPDLFEIVPDEPKEPAA